MKKALLTITAALTFATIANAQIRYGVKAGANLATIKTVHADAGDEDEKTDTKIGFNGGGFVTIPVSSVFSVQPEIVFSMEGGKEKEDNLKYNINCINIPVLMQYNAAGFFAETGPQLGFVMSGKAKSADQSFDFKEELKSTFFSWAVGAGYRLANGIGINARYNLGLSHIEKGDTKEGSVKSHVFQVNLSVAFGGK